MKYLTVVAIADLTLILLLHNICSQENEKENLVVTTNN